MVREFPRKSSRNDGNCFISKKRTIQPKIPEIPGGNFQEKIFENLGIPHEVVLFFGIYANSQSLIQC